MITAFRDPNLPVNSTGKGTMLNKISSPGKNVTIATISLLCLTLIAGLNAQKVFAGGPYQANGNGTITDTATSLVWQGVPENTKMNWQEAVQYCEELTIGNYSNWRLPESDELKELWSPNSGNNSCAIDPLFDCSPGYYMSNTRCGIGITDVGFGVMQTTCVHLSLQRDYVRCVHSPILQSSSYTLYVGKSGNGKGTVSDSSGRLRCLSGCTGSSASYPTGTIVTLSAKADNGSTFVEWSGGGCTGAGPCTVTMDSAQTVVARFTSPNTAKPNLNQILSILLKKTDNPQSGLSLTLPSRTITIDGSATDWAGIQPVFVDEQGDENPAADFVGTDIKAFYLAKDEQFLYMMIELYDGNPKTDMTTVYQFQANQSPVKYDTAGDYFVGAYTSPVSTNSFVLVNQRTATDDNRIAQYDSSYMEIGSKRVEWKAPLSDMGNLAGKYIRVYTHVLDGNYPVSDDQIIKRYITSGQVHIDCTGQPGGSAILDACGVCGGDGSTCSSSLGLLCSDTCLGSFCMSSATSICTDSDLSMPCMGTATGMFCSQSCSSDADCATPNKDMKCLTSCPDSPIAEGKCWTSSDHTFMVNIICPE